MRKPQLLDEFDQPVGLFRSVRPASRITERRLVAVRTVQRGVDDWPDETPDDRAG